MSEPSTPVTDHTSTAPPDGGPATRTGRRRIATFDDYPAAERAVERLTSHGFPVQRAAIVGRDLRSVEQIVGRLTVVTAVWRGALSGAVPGALIGWIFGLFAWINPLIGGLLLAAYGLVLGAVLGAVVGLVVYAFQRGRRDFTSVTVVEPRHFDLVVDEEVAAEATRLLDREV
ncbi:general stress protein [Pseudonocardia alni]|jgi:hypothetical protein|uniref:general stress protein n=1 Tax=Pseudonocardia alni TaxID=33907 RepID=UPI0033C6D469